MIQNFLAPGTVLYLQYFQGPIIEFWISNSRAQKEGVSSLTERKTRYYTGFTQWKKRVKTTILYKSVKIVRLLIEF